MPIKFIDSHAHITHSTAAESDIPMVLRRAQQAGLEAIINICTGPESLMQGLAVAQQEPWVYNAAATHPHDVEKDGENEFPFMAEHAKKGDIVAVGEIGLDYFYSHSDPAIQKKYLIKYLHLALECSLPVIIHCREAFDDFFEILDQEYVVNGTHAPGVLHCFTGNAKDAENVLKRGWVLSMSGIVTFKKSVELKEIAKWVPLDKLLIETDSPYLAPQSHRGKTNEPSFIPEIASMIAQLKGISLEEVADATRDNAKRLFGL